MWQHDGALCATLKYLTRTSIHPRTPSYAKSRLARFDQRQKTITVHHNQGYSRAETEKLLVTRATIIITRGRVL